MKQEEKDKIIQLFKKSFEEEFIPRHIINTKKLKDIKEFQIHPFLWRYLANYLEGNEDPETLAKVLIYPRILQSSVTTSFGIFIQKFLTTFISVLGSTTPGIDIEYTDQVDGRHKYCQLKNGPNALNNDDIKTVEDHFKDLIARGRTNHNIINSSDCVFGLIYGTRKEFNGNIKKLDRGIYSVLEASEFWLCYTGDEKFYNNLFNASAEVGKEQNMKELVENVISELSGEAKEKFDELYKLSS